MQTKALVYVRRWMTAAHFKECSRPETMAAVRPKFGPRVVDSLGAQARFMCRLLADATSKQSVRCVR